MFISEKLVYLAFLKTGCTHTIQLLESVPFLQGKNIGKHNLINEVPANELGDLSKKIKSGNIRNPWDWYVSLWAFGCMQKGGLYKHTVQKNLFRRIKHPENFFLSTKEWKLVYSDVNDVTLFKKWLQMLLNTNRKDVSFFRKTSNSIGYMTFKYLELYTYNFKKNITLVKDHTELKKFDVDNNFIDYFITNENLEKDFQILINKINTTGSDISGILGSPKTNRSIRTEYRTYYDNDLIELVREKDKLIIEKHKYEF